jgi:carboxymethylenebutenolidase
MRTPRFVALMLTPTLASLLAPAAIDQFSQPTALQVVEIRSGDLCLKAFFWRPQGSGPFPAVLFNHGSGAADSAHTGNLVIIDAAERLGPIFVRHGYAFLFLFRRGQGLSANQGGIHARSASA